MKYNFSKFAKEQQKTKSIIEFDKNTKITIKKNAWTALKLKELYAENEKKPMGDTKFLKKVLKLSLSPQDIKVVENFQSAELVEEVGLTVICDIFDLNKDEVAKQMRTEEGKYFMKSMTQSMTTGN